MQFSEWLVEDADHRPHFGVKQQQKGVKVNRLLAGGRLELNKNVWTDKDKIKWGEIWWRVNYATHKRG